MDPPSLWLRRGRHEGRRIPEEATASGLRSHPARSAKALVFIRVHSWLEVTAMQTGSTTNEHESDTKDSDSQKATLPARRTSRPEAKTTKVLVSAATPHLSPLPFEGERLGEEWFGAAFFQPPMDTNRHESRRSEVRVYWCAFVVRSQSSS